MFGTGAAIFSALLVITGAAKIRMPHDVARAIGSLGLPTITITGVVIGSLELMAGAAALFFPMALWAQAGLYAAFAGWITLALRRNVPIASCGCLGKDDTPPTIAHLVLNLIAVAVSVAAAADGKIAVLAGLGLVAQVAVIVVGVFLAYIVLTDGARLAGVRGR